MAIHVLYHSADLDGRCSGAILKRRYPDAVLHPINYGDEFPWSEVRDDDSIFMADFSLQPFNDMFILEGLVWIDHHISAIKQHEAKIAASKAPEMWKIAGVRDTSKAACRLTWEYCYPDKPVPEFVKMLSLYDTWVHNDPEHTWAEIEAFNTGLQTQETDPLKNPGFWNNWFTMDDVVESELIQYNMKVGLEIIGYLNIHNDHIIESNSHITMVDGHKAMIINYPDGRLINDMRESNAYRDNGCDIAVSYFSVKGKYWVVNFRSDTVDCVEVAKHISGEKSGGHPGAAGCEIETLPPEWFT